MIKYSNIYVFGISISKIQACWQFTTVLLTNGRTIRVLGNYIFNYCAE